MMTHLAASRAAAVTILFVAASSARAQGVASRCATDADCKGTQICYHRACVAPPPECPLDAAADVHFVITLQKVGVTEAQFKELIEAGIIDETVPAVCQREVEYASAHPNRKCQIDNGIAFYPLTTYVGVSRYLFLVTGDASAFFDDLRAIERYFLTSVRHECWFQDVQLPARPPASNPSADQCRQLRTTYEACTRQARHALERCT